MAQKATGVTEFSGGRVRMWQGGSQVEAGMIDLDKGKKTLVARNGGEPVRTVMSQEKGGAVRVLSETLRYSDAARQVNFAGKVVVTGQDGTLKAQDAVVYLLPAAGTAPQNGSAEPGLFWGEGGEDLSGPAGWN